MWRLAFALLPALFTSIALFAQPAAPECVSCHDTTGVAAVGTSIHASIECVDCHAAAATVPHTKPLAPVDCSSCHPESVAAWNASLHANPRARGAKGARCENCHGPAHQIAASSDSRSSTFRAAIPATCQRCHAQKFVVESGAAPNVAVSYRESVHGRELARGSAKAAVCTDCHDSHAVRPANEPQSSIFKFNVPRVCGQCHAAIATQYGVGLHGTALARGNWSSPVCTDCHGIHTISRIADPARGPRASCARCHQSVQLAMELGMPADRVSSYAASYHGLARKLGSNTAADCASCHGAHEILPSSDPRSAVHRDNLPQTCGKCHPGAQANFARGRVHVVQGDLSDLPSRLNTWIRWIYIAAIAGSMAFMLLHNFLLWWRKSQRIRREQKRNVVRMNRNQRIQHLLLMTSFIVLVLSGFALAWPESLFAKLFGSSEELRRIIHRVAAVVMMAVGVYHIGYLLFMREGRMLLRDIRPRFSDFRDVFAFFRYYLGFGGVKPAFARFSYGEKLEYWAGMWGSAVMTITGIMLWFPVLVTSNAPRWWIDIATTIHFYEAVLATLSILVWHLYHVIFDPDVYPMNWSWLDGKMSDELYHEEHGRDET
jgi:cytochrome b subunit of formate dehydrogenase